MERFVCKKDCFWRNLKRNWFFPISALAYFFVNAREITFYIPGAVLCFAAAVITAGSLPAVGKNRFAQVAALLGSVGAALFSYEAACLGWEGSYKAEVLGRIVPMLTRFGAVICAIAAAASVPFLYAVLRQIWSRLVRVLWSERHLKSIGLGEGLIYAVLGVLLCAVVVLGFGASRMFYDTDLPCDLVYTSDSPGLMQNNVFLNLTHQENDIRQPLFAVFASPAAGILFLLQWVLRLGLLRTAILNGVCQVLLLLLANFILAGSLGTKGTGRAAMVVLLCCLYSSVLFTVMVEQYIIAFFWLMLLVDALLNREDITLPLCGAGGTLMTSLAMAAMALEGKKLRQFAAEMIRCGVCFAVVLFLFCRFDLISDFLATREKLGTFMGTHVGTWDRILQYLSFVSSCFLAPKAGAAENLEGILSWQLLPVTNVNWLGFGLLVLSGIGFVCSRRDRLCRIALYWVLFSAAVLVGIGWGTAENGLILYSLYFGWAFFVPICKLAVKLPTFWRRAALGITMLELVLINGQGLAALIRFGIANYPG